MPHRSRFAFIYESSVIVNLNLDRADYANLIAQGALIITIPALCAVIMYFTAKCRLRGFTSDVWYSRSSACIYGAHKEHLSKYSYNGE